MRTTRISLLGCCVLVALSSGCNTSSPENPLLALFDLRAETFQRVYSLGGTENRTDEAMVLLSRTMVSAKTSLYCSFEDVNLPWVLQALLFHKNRGIDVKIGIDADNKDGVGFTQLASFLDSNPLSAGQRLYYGNGGSGQVYLNTCVADGIRVWVSSIAPSLPGAYQAAGFAYYLQSGEDGIARKFAVEMDLVTHGSFGSAKQRLNRRNHWLVGDVDIGVYMAPAESPLANFLTPRLQSSRQAVRVYGSEFFANKLESSSSASGKVRKAGDVAYDMSAGPAAFRQVVGGWWTYNKADPDEKNGLNSMKYLKGLGNVDLRVRAGGFPSNGVNIVLLDDTGAAFNPATRNQNFPMALIMSHSLHSRADSSHDGVTFVFENTTIIDEITNFYNQLRDRAVSESSIGTTGQAIAVAGQREVVISELNWAGGYSNTNSSATARDYVELYNNGSGTLNISRWRMDCGNAGGFATNILTLPDRTLIGPGQYFVVDRSSNSFILKPALTLGTTVPGAGCNAGNAGTCVGYFASIITTFDQCRLTDASGTVVDTFGVNGTAFDTDTNHFGLNDTTGLNRRSMERTNLTADGTALANWHTNANVNTNNYNIKADYHKRTFGTPGYANGPDGLALQSATATSLTTVRAVFSANPEVGGASNAGNYCVGLGTDTTTCSNVLGVTGATVSGATVTVTTATQTKGTSYKLFVTNVTSEIGAALLVNSAAFTGFFTQATLVINEVAPSQTSSLDLVELYAVTTGSTLGYTLYEGSASVRLVLPDVNVTAGDYIVIHLNTTGTNESSSKTQSTDTGHYLGAWDFWAPGSGLTGTDNVITLRNTAGAVVDALIFGNNGGTWTGSGESLAVSVLQWTQAGGSWAESDSVNLTTANNTSYQQLVDGSASNNINTAWQVAAISMGRKNGSPGVSPSPAPNATGVAVNANVVLTFTEAMNVAVGTVTVTGTSSGAQTGLACVWTVGNTVCTIDPPTDFNTTETVTVTLSGFLDAGDGLAPDISSYSFATVNPGLVPTVTNVVVASTVPNNGTTPYNTGTVTVTITGTNFQASGGVACPAGVRLDDLNGAGGAVNTVAQSCTVNSDTQITATFPAGIRTNGSTGWNVIATNGTGSNTTSTVKFAPRAGLLISEVVQNGPNGASNEFVEIYNPTGLAIDIGALGLRMHTRSSAGANTNKTLTTINGATRGDGGCTTNDTTIPSHGFYLISSSAASAEGWWAKRNMTFSAGITGTGGVIISLSATADLLVIDKVGWGTQSGGNPNYEGTALPALSSSDSVERKPAGGGGHATDTDDNSADFNPESATLTPRYCLDAAQP